MVLDCLPLKVTTLTTTDLNIPETTRPEKLYGVVPRRAEAQITPHMAHIMKDRFEDEFERNQAHEIIFDIVLYINLYDTDFLCNQAN